MKAQSPHPSRLVQLSSHRPLPSRRVNKDFIAYRFFILWILSQPASLATLAWSTGRCWSAMRWWGSWEELESSEPFAIAVTSKCTVTSLSSWFLLIFSICDEWKEKNYFCQHKEHWNLWRIFMSFLSPNDNSCWEALNLSELRKCAGKWQRCT